MNLESVSLGGLDYIGIFVGGIAYYALGALWYTVLLGQAWVAATGRTREEFPANSPAWMGVTLVGAVVSTGVVAIVFRWGGGDSVVDGLVVGALIAVGVVAMEMLKDVVYNFDAQRNKWRLYVLNTAYAVLGLTLAGGVYGLIASL